MCRSYVELDNFLPLYVKMRSKFSGTVRVQSLITSPNELLTPMVSKFVPPSELFGPMDLVVPNFWSKLSMFIQSNWLHKVSIKNNIFKEIRKKILSFCDRICRKKFNINCDAPALLVLSESNFKGLKNDDWKIGSLSEYFNTLIENPAVYKIIFPETFDQWNEKPEFFLANERIVKMSDFFLSRGEQTKLNSIVPSAKTINIGAPRYSKFWCDQLAEFFLSSKSELYSSKGLKVLYVPIKISPGLPASTAEDIEAQDRLVFELLDRHEGLQVWVKPHPKTYGIGYEKNKLFDYTKHVERISVFDNSTDTSELAYHSDIIISPGSSFIPHCIWLDKPVILLDEWAKRSGYSFTFENLCFSIKDIDHILGEVALNKSFLTTQKQKEMQSFFQLGMDCRQYEEFLSSTMNKLGKTVFNNY